MVRRVSSGNDCIALLLILLHGIPLLVVRTGLRVVTRDGHRMGSRRRIMFCG